MSHLILVGFMGCGKSKLGRRLSYRLRRPFLDTDKEIEMEQEASINQIFAEHGEAYFRSLETNCLKALLWEKEEHVVSTGGGIVIREENRELMKMLGTVVYLKVSPLTVYERLKGDNSRPLLQGTNQLEKITRMMSQRKHYYEAAAHYVVEVDGKSLDELTEEVRNLII